MLLRLTLISAALATCALATVAQAQDVKLAEETPGLAGKAKITFVAAQASAQAKVPKGKLVTAELEQEDGKLQYSLVYKTPGAKGVDEVNVDAVTGKVVGVEHENSEPKKDKDDDKSDAKGKAGKKGDKDKG